MVLDRRSVQYKMHTYIDVYFVLMPTCVRMYIYIYITYTYIYMYMYIYVYIHIYIYIYIFKSTCHQQEPTATSRALNQPGTAVSRVPGSYNRADVGP